MFIIRIEMPRAPLGILVRKRAGRKANVEPVAYFGGSGCDSRLNWIPIR